MNARISQYICRTLHCDAEAIQQWARVPQGHTNEVFSFVVQGQRYLFRAPGRGSAQIIDRWHEYEAMQWAAALGLDLSLVACEPARGWKISRYFAASFAGTPAQAEARSLALIRRLHAGGTRQRLGWDFAFFPRAVALQALVPTGCFAAYTGFAALCQAVRELQTYWQQDGVPWEMCHNDCCAQNILLGDQADYLIDWEYAGDNDPVADIATFIIGEPRSAAAVDRILGCYYQRPLTAAEWRHSYGGIALSAYFYFVWGVYEENIGNEVGGLTPIWYHYLQEYTAKALALYRTERGYHL